MLVGKDFDKLEWHAFGLKLLEPNAFIGDVLIFLVAMYFANKIHKLSDKSSFVVYWNWFFIVFGFSFLVGGFGHLFFNYAGAKIKYVSWSSGIFSCFLMEIAFISIFPNLKWKKILRITSIAKMTMAYSASMFVFCTFNLDVDPAPGLVVPTINSIIGVFLTIGVLGNFYRRKIDSSFKFFWMSNMMLLISAVFQQMKINFSQYFDRNEVSHVLIIISLMLYFKCIKLYANRDKLDDMEIEEVEQ